MTTKTATKATVTPINPANSREVEMMMGKAMCAWANATTGGYHQIERYRHMAMAEYEATARCIDMFVREPLWKVCSTIIERAKAEFGIELAN